MILTQRYSAATRRPPPLKTVSTMAAIAQHDLAWATADPWGEIATACMKWAADQQLRCCDVILLLPFAQLLPVARRAFGASGGWMPRIETTQTLSRGLGPAEPPAPWELSLDVANDTMTARNLLQNQAWATAWRVDDPRGYAQGVDELVRCAHAIARAGHGVPPGQRSQHWEAARALSSAQPAASGTPGARERALSRVALEWAATGPAPASDRLFAVRPAGWIALQAGGPDALTECLLSAASEFVPCLRLSTDFSPAAAFVAGPRTELVAVAVCDDFESEAQQSAACVLGHLQSGLRPVALIAQDRLLVRRVRALLARQGVSILDETGWTLSTTRGAAGVRSLLGAAQPDASADDWLDWLKACGPAPGDLHPSSLHAPAALDELELALRAQKSRKAWSVAPENLPLAAAALWRAARSALHPVSTLDLASGNAWLEALGRALRISGQRAALSGDDAGRQVLAALRLHVEPSQAGMVFSTEPMGLDEFLTWVESVLEQATYMPQAPESASVVITPLARAMLRPFAATVFAGTDERHLGAAAPSPGLLSRTLSSALGLPDRHEVPKTARAWLPAH
jgi:ATP-dependent helicase/nuclease subunit B